MLEARPARFGFIPKEQLPTIALSVRQPWAWAIIHAGKDIENRSWQAINHGLKKRGRIAIHASKNMSQDEYHDALEFMKDIGVDCPLPADMKYGGIIGAVDVVDVVQTSESRWWMGPRGLVLRNPVASPYVPARGALGYFSWEESAMSDIPAIRPWMMKLGI